MSEHSEDTTKGLRDYKECTIHWTRGITILEVTHSYWAAGLVAIATAELEVSTTVVTRLELHTPLATWT